MKEGVRIMITQTMVIIVKKVPLERAYRVTPYVYKSHSFSALKYIFVRVNETLHNPIEGGIL